MQGDDRSPNREAGRVKPQQPYVPYRPKNIHKHGVEVIDEDDLVKQAVEGYLEQREEIGGKSHRPLQHCIE